MFLHKKWKVLNFVYQSKANVRHFLSIKSKKNHFILKYHHKLLHDKIKLKNNLIK